jgi:two-component system, NarL family, sensor histidine kinase UhpB
MRQQLNPALGRPVLRLNAPALAALCTKAMPPGERIEAAAVMSASEAIDVTMLILTPPSARTARQLDALLKLLSASALSEIVGAEKASSAGFWRERSMSTTEALAEAKSELSRVLAEYRGLEDAAAQALHLEAEDRFERLGPLIATAGPFDAWILAVSRNGALGIAAASPSIGGVATLEWKSAIADSFNRQATILRFPKADHAVACHEDRIFADYAAYLCVPFLAGSIALAAREPIEPGMRARAETRVARLAPLVKCWAAEAEAEQLRHLVHNLGLRMFAAVDTERARIARDLHDDQAQLLAAARIALDTGGDQAREILKQVEQEMRARVRELRPAVVGQHGLEAAIRLEFRRLEQRGIKARLTRIDNLDGLPQPVQELCYQTAREAFSNAIRHSGAARIEVRLERSGGRTRLEIRDNGKGMAGRAQGGGMGLDGLRERLELLGGTLRIESRAGLTKVIAEIPEPL